MENINLIRHISWSFHKTTGIDYQELFSEACLAYCEALQSFNPDKGKLNNYATTLIHNKLKTFIGREKYHGIKKAAFPELPTNPTMVHEFIENLPEYVKQFAALVLDNLEEVDDTLSPCKARGKIAEILHDQGMFKADIHYNFKQLKIALRNGF
jgi:DNA-directed RNA polymerase sigma subunit (sigma70/sigma32)